MINNKPYAPLRFLVLQHCQTEKLAWCFGDGQHDHAQMETAYQKQYGREWGAVGGGFYTLMDTDKLRDGAFVKDLVLFGKSGSFGLADWVLEEGVPVLELSLDKFTDVIVKKEGKPQISETPEKWVKHYLTLEEYPIGTKAKALMGGYWEKVERGWKWCTGAMFPTPGGDWTGEVSLPVNNLHK